MREVPGDEGLPPWASVGPARREHVRRVAALVASWAEAMAVPEAERRRWLRAAWLHDALRDLPVEELRALLPACSWPPGLLHGPAAAERAAAEGERDAGVLAAVRYHSLGWPEWDRAGTVLYCADYLEPGRRFDAEGRAELARRFPGDPDGVVREVARRRLASLVADGLALPEPTWRFWNALTAPTA